MRKRYRWDPKLRKVVYVGVVRGPNLNGTAQVGDIPDLMRDAKTFREQQAQINKERRKQTIIDAVNQAEAKPKADSYEAYIEREKRSYE